MAVTNQIPIGAAPPGASHLPFIALETPLCAANSSLPCAPPTAMEKYLDFVSSLSMLLVGVLALYNLVLLVLYLIHKISLQRYATLTVWGMALTVPNILASSIRNGLGYRLLVMCGVMLLIEAAAQGYSRWGPKDKEGVDERHGEKERVGLGRKAWLLSPTWLVLYYSACGAATGMTVGYVLGCRWEGTAGYAALCATGIGGIAYADRLARTSKSATRRKEDEGHSETEAQPKRRENRPLIILLSFAIGAVVVGIVALLRGFCMA